MADFLQHRLPDSYHGLFRDMRATGRQMQRAYMLAHGITTPEQIRAFRPASVNWSVEMPTEWAEIQSKRQAIRDYTFSQCMGVVTNTTYIKCYWPSFDRPVVLFAPGSSGIQVMGPPTPRNILFPAGTVFLDRVPDADYPAEQAVYAAFPARKGTSLINLTAEETAVYLSAHAAAMAALPLSATRVATVEVFYLRDHFPALRKRRTWPISKLEAVNLVQGNTTEAALKLAHSADMIEEDE